MNYNQFWKLQVKILDLEVASVVQSGSVGLELTVVVVGLVAWLWLAYVFSGYFGHIVFGSLI